MKLIIDSDNPKLRIFGLTQAEHFERAHLAKPNIEGVVYIKQHDKGDIVSHITSEEGSIHVTITQSNEQSEKMRARRKSGDGDLVLYEEGKGPGQK